MVPLLGLASGHYSTRPSTAEETMSCAEVREYIWDPYKPALDVQNEASKKSAGKLPRDYHFYYDAINFQKKGLAAKRENFPW